MAKMIPTPTDSSFTSGLRSKAKIRLVEFIRPDGCWPYPYTIEPAFQVFRWMVKTGAAYRDRGQWGYSGVTELLSKNPSCCGFSAVDPILSLADLRLRFHWALLSNCGVPATQRWRQERRIAVDAEHILCFPHYAPFEGAMAARADFRTEGMIGDALNDLLSEKNRGVPFQTQLNYVHRDARVAHRIVIAVRATAFDFILDYGFNAGGPGQMDSEWHETLASVGEDEPFVNGLDRALTHFAAIRSGTEPDHRPEGICATVEDEVASSSPAP